MIPITMATSTVRLAAWRCTDTPANSKSKSLIPFPSRYSRTLRLKSENLIKFLHPIAMATPTATATTGEPYVVEDVRGILKVMSDGTVIRSPNPPSPASFPDDGSVEWKDLLFHPIHSLYVRLYRPVKTPPNTKLPVLAMFHGGGFCIGSRAWPNFHAACHRLSAEFSALVLSFDYRLAPEHRLPAAIGDAEAALLWLSSQCTGPDIDPWLAESGDFTKVFISGESAGGVLTHHMAVRFGTCGLNPVQVRGYIPIVPSMVEKEPTQSELECPEDAFLNRDAWDRYVRLSLPADHEPYRDDPALNPFSSKSPNLENVEMGPVLVVAAERDMFIDPNMNYVKRLKEMGKKAEIVQIAGEEHAFFSTKPLSEPTGEVIQAFRRFMDRSGDGSY